MGEVFAAKARSKRCTRPMPSPTPTSTRWPPSRPSSKPSSPPPAPIPSTSWKSPPTRCACRPGTPIELLSGGEKRRVALCRLLLSKPDMLLLDEPTNHLDAESVEWLEQFLQRFPGTVVAITHDRYFLDNAAEWILELDRGRGIPWKGNYSTWLEQKGAPGAGAEGRGSPRQGTEEGTGVVAPEPQGAPGQEQIAPGPLRGTERHRIPEAQRNQRNLHPGGRAPGQ
jgi:sulfate-transporting ATPase